MKNDVFKEATVQNLFNRINKLTPNTNPLWGKMDAGQMLAHLNVTYEMVYEDKHPKPNAFVKFMLKLIVKNKVVSSTPYKRDGRTAPQFIMTESKDFNREKKRLEDFLVRTQKLGENHFDGLESHSFGNLTTDEWNNMFYKHIDHHLSQFGSVN